MKAVNTVSRHTSTLTHLSVAILSLAILVKSSELALSEPGTLVSGVFAPESLAEPVSMGVPVDEPPLAALTEPFAAFSARRFCFEADGGILFGWWRAMKNCLGQDGSPILYQSHIPIAALTCLTLDQHCLRHFLACPLPTVNKVRLVAYLEYTILKLVHIFAGNSEVHVICAHSPPTIPGIP